MGIGGGGDGGSSADVGTTVSISSTGFDPKRASLEPGQAVRFVNEDERTHRIRALSDGGADWEIEADLEAGQETTQTFEEAGQYQFYCQTHTKFSECGAVLVGDAEEGSLPC